MTRDDIIKLAREAGFAEGVAEIVGLEGFANFAALVAAAEREKLARWMRSLGYATHCETIEDLLNSLGTQIAEGLEAEVLMEREWLAQALEHQARIMADYFEVKWILELVAAIRARSAP